MKSIFLAALLSALVSSASAQAPKKKVVDPPANPRATQTSTMPVAAKPATAAEKTAFEKFYDRMSINYFGAYTSSPLENWHSDFAITSPEFQTVDKRCKQGNCDDYAQNIFSQVTFAYNYGGGNKFIIQPRWTTFLGKAPVTAATGDKNVMILLEDMLVGWSTNLFTSEDKKLSWNIRPAVRLPTSRLTRNSDVPEYGDVTHQPDINTSVSYTANDQWSFSYALQNRFWVYEDRYNEARHRIAQSFSANYKLSDSTSLSGNFEYWLQNNRNRESIDGDGTFYDNFWQNAYLGVSQDVTPKLNVTPILGAYVNDVKFGMRSAYLGLWIAYSIK